jgi:hypothetical protein
MKDTLILCAAFVISGAFVVLKRDMTALFGVRRVLELEHTFLYLCMHDGGLLDMPDLS